MNHYDSNYAANLDRDDSDGVTAKLLPCPFCGDEAISTTELPGGWKHYGCFECGIKACTPEDWNRRVQPKTPALDEILEGLEKALEKGSGFYVVADGPGEAAVFSEELIMAAIAEHRGEGKA